MRIGILEWICGGGLQTTEQSQIEKSLLNEGWAMLNAVAQDFVHCGYEVIASVDPRLIVGAQLSDFESRIRVSKASGLTNGLPSSWWEIVSEADAVIVIAPEFSSILQTAIAQLAPACKLLLNCEGEFLAAACDKWLTAQRLDADRVNHPVTQLASEATEGWLKQHRNRSGKWIIKPRDGAGCEAIQLAAENSVRDVLSEIESDLKSRTIIQPFHSGNSFSRSAIVDSSGGAHWLPLVTQEFNVGDSMAYCGGRVLSVNESHYEDLQTGKRYSIARIDDILDATIGALGQGARGWVGVDLLYSDESDDWIVIEVNPRLTTSFTGLRMAYGPGLMQQMQRAVQGLEVAIGSSWRSIAFDSAGNLGDI